jgi:molecular chaperone GrpE
MGDEKNTSADVSAGDVEDIEIEFVDEASAADRSDERTAEPVVQEPADEPEEPVELGPSIEIEIERLERELDELREIHLRKLAEFDNFRKRTERERVEIKRFANEDMMRDLLPVLDNFERALEHGSETDAGAFREGVEMIAKQLWDTLQKQGVEAIDPLGESFSPEFHEAVHQIHDPEREPGTVASVLAKGYLCNGRLIRPAMVGVVSNRITSREEKSAASPNAAAQGGADE